MAHASTCGWRWTRALALTAGLLAAASFTLTAAQPPKQDDKPVEPVPGQHVKVISLPSDSPSDLVEMKAVIDRSLEEGWKANKLTPSRPADDYEFIRRATLDIIGRVAKPAEIDQFLKDDKKHRRTLLVERLLKSPEYPRHWANLWTNWLLSRAGVFGRGLYHDQLATWLEDQFAQNRPYSEIMKALVTAKGKNTDNPEVNFILAHVGEPVPQARRAEDGQFDMVPITARVTRLFLGVQTQCAQCHDHPFDANLKQEHFWGINVFLRQVTREGTPPMERRRDSVMPLTLKEDSGANKLGVIAFEKRNGVLKETKARFLNGKQPARDAASRRDELASMIADSDQFPRALANRIWGVFFGKGFTNPVDDFNEQNPPSNPELLDELAKKFRHYGFDQKRLIRWICNSEAYNLSCVANKTNDKPEHEVFFSRMLLKSMSPEQLFESLMVATQTEQTKEAREQNRDRWLGNLVSNFGDDEGNEVNFNGTVVQALLMMNGQDLNSAISREEGGTVTTALTRFRLPLQRVDYLYRATLNRPVSKAEFARIDEKTKMNIPDRSPRAPYEDLLWALLNSNEFLLNH